MRLILKRYFSIISFLFLSFISANPPNDGGPPVPFGGGLGDDSSIDMYVLVLIIFFAILFLSFILRRKFRFTFK